MADKFWIVWLYYGELICSSVPFDDKEDAQFHADLLKGRKGVKNPTVVKR